MNCCGLTFLSPIACLLWVGVPASSRGEPMVWLRLAAQLWQVKEQS